MHNNAIQGVNGFASRFIACFRVSRDGKMCVVAIQHYALSSYNTSLIRLRLNGILLGEAVAAATSSRKPKWAGP